jgi:uncharacterized protein (TIGR03067 family)
MMQKSLTILGILALLATSAAEDETRKDRERLQATWHMVSLETNGRKAPENEIKNFKMVIAGDVLSFKDGIDVKATIKQLDATTNPRLIDLEFKQPGLNGVLEGIYKIEDDTLTLCLYSVPDARQRPAEFTGKEGSNQFLIVFRREKP